MLPQFKITSYGAFAAALIALATVTVHAQSAATNSVTASATTNGMDHPTYLRDMVPIFMGDCFRCHNSQSKFLPDWTNYKIAYDYRKEIKRRVWDSWQHKYYKQSMPAGNGAECRSITVEQRELVRDWVNSGAEYGVAPVATTANSTQERIQMGQHLFSTICAACHQANGQGIPEKFPPLVKSDYLNASKDRGIAVVLHGLQGPVTVNGQTYNNSMPGVPLRDEDVANVLTYLYSSFGNSGKVVTPDDVKQIRAQKVNMPSVRPPDSVPARSAYE